MVTRMRVSALFTAARTMARLFILSLLIVSGGAPVYTASTNAGMALACRVGSEGSATAGTGTGTRSRSSESDSRAWPAWNSSAPSHRIVPFDPTILQRLSQLVLAPSAHQDPR